MGRKTPMHKQTGSKTMLAILAMMLPTAGRLSILKHELAHWKRRNLLKSTLVRLLVLPHWFNPLAWAAAARLGEVAEWACDEAAKGATLEGCREYAKALLQLDAIFGPRLSYRAAASGRGLSARVQRLLCPHNEKDSIMKKAMVFGAALGFVLLGLVRVNLVAQEPAPKGPPSTLQKPADTNIAAGSFREKYAQWQKTGKTKGGIDKLSDEEKKLLSDLVEGAYVVTFRPVGGFAPKTPAALIEKFSDSPVLKSDSTGFGGASFFRTKAKDGVLIGSFLSAIPEDTRKALEATGVVKVLSIEELTPEKFIQYEASPQESLGAGTFSQKYSSPQGSSGADTFWQKYSLWERGGKKKGSVERLSEDEKKLLAELVEGAYVVTFRPIGRFAPKTPEAYLQKFSNSPVLKSDSTGLGGGSFFRTKAMDRVLIGSFLSARPEDTRKALEATGVVEVLSIEELTPEKFIRYDASRQQSLR